VRHQSAEPRGDGDLHDGARYGDAPHGEQVGDGEVQPHPNMRRMTPISASCDARPASAT
jgi:hypothetical protein